MRVDGLQLLGEGSAMAVYVYGMLLRVYVEPGDRVRVAWSKQG